MRMHRWGIGTLALAMATLWLGGIARADVTTEQSGSILAFPKVIADGSRDTIIQISNTSNSLVRAHCFYVDGALSDPSQAPGPLNPPRWQEIDFDITLTKQQPTHWVVSEGRRVNPFDQACGPNGVCVGGTNDGASCQMNSHCDSYDCSAVSCRDAGFDPGLIPPVVSGFTGELKCVEVDDSGAPLSGNHLKGEATLVDVSGPYIDVAATADGFIGVINSPTLEPGPIPLGEVSKYNAIAILGNENNGDSTLVLGGGQCVGDGAQHGQLCSADADCADAAPCALEYNACPQTWILNHEAEGAPDLIMQDLGFDEALTSVDTELTVIPCTENFETQVPTSVTLQFDTTNEFESHFSVSTTVRCWGNFRLADVGATALTYKGQTLLDPFGTMFLQTRIRSAAGTPVGVLMVAEEFHTGESGVVMDGTTVALQFTSTAAVNLHIEGQRSNPDIITIPADQLLP